MDKAWVWLPRASLEYEQGAINSVETAAKRLGYPDEMFFPCLECRNVSHQPVCTVLDHLVMKGMDLKYERKTCWNKHGDIKDESRGPDETNEYEAYNLFRTTFFHNEDLVQSSDSMEEEYEGHQDGEQVDEFRKKLKDAETPLYSSCPNYSKVSAIMALYRLKVRLRVECRTTTLINSWRLFMICCLRIMCSQSLFLTSRSS